MQINKLVLILCISVGMLSVSCRDIDNKKDLNSQEDGTREINATELEGVDRRETSDTTDAMIDERNQYEDSIYRENDMHLQHAEQQSRQQGQNPNRTGN